MDRLEHDEHLQRITAALARALRLPVQSGSRAAALPEKIALIAERESQSWDG